MREITHNLGWVAAALVLLVAFGLIHDSAVAWVAAVPSGLLILVVAGSVAESANYNAFADSPLGLLMALGALGLLGCVIARAIAAVPDRRPAPPQ